MVASFLSASTSSAITPTTAGLPNCRATSAAWLVRPPRLVRMPRAASMPCTSSGLVSARIITTAFFSFAQRTAVSASKASWPTAAPGDTLRPLARSRRSDRAVRIDSGSNCGWRKKSTCSGVTRSTASSRVISFSFARSTAIFTAARAVRLASRVWSIHSVPRSTVNSMSCTSR